MKAMIMLLSIFLISSSLALATEKDVPDGYALVPIDHLREALWYHDAYYIELALREEAEITINQIAGDLQKAKRQVTIYRAISISTACVIVGAIIAAWGFSR